jgi:hypothetical protein
VIRHVPIAKIVRAPDDEFTVQIDGVAELKTISPVFEGEVSALTECVPAGSPRTMPTGFVPKLRLSGATGFTVAELEELVPVPALLIAATRKT